MANPNHKFKAFQGLVARHYVPAFVAKCAAHGMVFTDEADLAHALQLNGKLAAVLGDGVSLDSLVDAIAGRLNVKSAAVNDSQPISLAALNYAFDGMMKDAGTPISDDMRAKQASLVQAVPSEDIRDFQTLNRK